jgi:hypothetical protein
MPKRELMRATPESSEDHKIQVVMMLPVRPRRKEIGKDERAITPAAAAGLDSRISRVTRLMALAIKFQDMVTRGEVRDFADIARLGYVTRARLTQIMNLLLLAPDIQEHLLDTTPPATNVSERNLRSIVARHKWADQRQAWNALNPKL